MLQKFSLRQNQPFFTVVSGTLHAQICSLREEIQFFKNVIAIVTHGFGTHENDSAIPKYELKQTSHYR